MKLLHHLMLGWLLGTVSPLIAADLHISQTPAKSDYVRVMRSADAERNKFTYINPVAARWPSVLHWSYNHAGAPAAFDRVATIQLMTDALAKWSAACGIVTQYDGETTIAPGTVVDDQPDRVNVVGWYQDFPDASAYVDSHGEFDPTGGVLTDSDMFVNTWVFSGEGPFFGNLSFNDLRGIVVHEWGHMLGLGHSNFQGNVMSGFPYTTYLEPSHEETLQTDDITGCRCLYGLPTGTSASFLCGQASNLDFGIVPVGAPSAPQQLIFTASGNQPVTIKSASVYSIFYRVSDNTCTPGRILSLGETCSLNINSVGTQVGLLYDQLRVDSSAPPVLIQLTAEGLNIPPPDAPAVRVIEYYHAGLDHYFMTLRGDEIAALDSGQPSGWKRTGNDFGAYASPIAGTIPVCRYYIPPAYGDSHVYSAFPDECAAIAANYPNFVLESSEAMDVVPFDPNYDDFPVCPSGFVPVYRVWNARADTNHRYTTDRAIRDAMVARGWIAEGAGPDAIAFCSAFGG